MKKLTILGAAVARKCDGPNMIYETENGGSTGKGAFAIRADDPHCGGNSTR